MTRVAHKDTATNFDFGFGKRRKPHKDTDTVELHEERKEHIGREAAEESSKATRTRNVNVNVSSRRFIALHYTGHWDTNRKSFETECDIGIDVASTSASLLPRATLAGE